jgi:hypothetical protein
VLLAIFVAALLVAGFGPKSAQTAGFVIAVFVALFIGAAQLPIGMNRGTYTSLATRREDFDPHKRDLPDESLTTDASQDAWQAERERYERKREGS